MDGSHVHSVGDHRPGNVGCIPNPSLPSRQDATNSGASTEGLTRLVNFLNGTLLIAITAIGIPIALHLIARKEPRKVLFPSVRLLSQRFESNRSKMRVRRWWLLALRIAAIASVALALARPVSSIGLSVTWLTIGIIAALGVVLLVMATVSASGRGKRSLTIPLLAAAGLLVLVAMGWGVFTVASTEPPMIDDQRPVALAIIVDNSIETSWTTTEDTRINAIREAAKAAAWQRVKTVEWSRSIVPRHRQRSLRMLLARLQKSKRFSHPKWCNRWQRELKRPPVCSRPARSRLAKSLSSVA
ncbi:hypothetical protein C2E31_04735 [Rhodopirellula baltica]|nr:hypothetical protein C2E31_04735 [Rhodopirellula baltica]